MPSFGMSTVACLRFIILIATTTNQSVCLITFPGARVSAVEPGSAAEAAGIRLDDIIQSVDGRSLVGAPVESVRPMLSTSQIVVWRL